MLYVMLHTFFIGLAAALVSQPLVMEAKALLSGSCLNTNNELTTSCAMQVRTSNRFLQGMLGVLAVATLALGPLAVFNLYVMPYWLNVVWLDVVTYLHHHGPSDPAEKMPWYRGKVSSSQHLH